MESGHLPLGSGPWDCDGFRMANPPGHRALRKGRMSLPGQIYLLTTTTADRNPWFLDMDFAIATCRLMIEPKTWGDARPLCWVLMPDHWHGLVELGERDDLSLVMNRFKAVTSKRIRQTAPIPRIWARGFHDHALRCDEDIHAAARYIIANPLRARLVDHTGDYPYWDCIWL
ncbi:transposase [Rhodanobacter sp. C01]|uniref:REP-associated tyrosine transposase n=1 Tax=Rhodanobacter sp. C01 TaxID=1945856 RepID=UPI0031B5DC7A